MVIVSKKKGGWGATKYLTWQQVKDVKYLVKEAKLNVCLHIMPDTGDDKQRKRFIQKITAHIGQAIKRRGYEHCSVTVFEKGGPKNCDLHGHFMLHIDKANHDIIDRYADGKVIDVDHLPRPLDRDAMANYITKQRRPLSPDFEKQNRHRYEKEPAPIHGKRISFSKEAKAILDAQQAQSAPLATNRPTRSLPSKAHYMKPSGQIEMFPELATPAKRLGDYHGGILSPSAALELEHHRKRHGLTQSQLGIISGLSQPQIANAVHGRFGLSRQAGERLVSVLLERRAA